MDGLKLLQADQTPIGDMQRRSIDCTNWKLSKLSNFENFLGLDALSTQCVLLSRLFLRAYYAEHFQNSYIDDNMVIDKTSLFWLKKKFQNYRILKIYEDFVIIWLYVQLCPGRFSELVYQILFKICIMILRILRMWNVVVLREKSRKMSKIMEFWKFMKT